MSMNEDQGERLVAAWEGIAKALEGLKDEVRRAGKRYWPEPGPQREAIVTHALTEEEKSEERRRQADNMPIDEWLTNFREPGEPEEAEGVVGERSRQWAKDHPNSEAPKEAKKPDAGAEAPVRDKKGAKGTSEAKDQA